ncbi:MAG: amidohydrolase family protein [Candidatus Methanofastidiosa archaeon]|nr:amidohydrolase family protein [Candidatus Methanofastidiosa archaeon]
MSEFSLVIKNARINDTTISDIGINNGIIEKIGKLKGGNTIIDANKHYVLSGFVNSHCHLDKSNLLDKMTEDHLGKTLEENRILLKKLKSSYSSSDIERRATDTIEKMLSKGITAIRTQVDVDPTAGVIPIKSLLKLKEKYKDRAYIELAAFPQEGVVDEAKRDLMEKAMELGADVVGGLPLVESKGNERKHLEILFELAKQHNKNLDIQVDETNDPRMAILPEVLKKIKEENFQGRVTVTHAIALSRLPTEKAKEIIDQMKALKVNVIVTPSANMITRFAEVNDLWIRPSNSITRVTELYDNGINVAIGTDNVRDIFYPFGNCSMIRELHMLVSATRMTTRGYIDGAIAMATTNGAKLLGLNYGIDEGRQADIIITDGISKLDILNSDETIPCVIKNGNILSLDENKFQRRNN